MNCVVLIISPNSEGRIKTLKAAAYSPRAEDLFMRNVSVGEAGQGDLWQTLRVNKANWEDVYCSEMKSAHMSWPLLSQKIIGF